MQLLYDIDFEDIVSTKCPNGVTMSQVLLGFFSTDSRFVKGLMKLRNKLVSLAPDSAFTYLASDKRLYCNMSI
jgi:hypothetical protein